MATNTTQVIDGRLCISNQGIVEADALRLMGASTKRDQAGKIGYFGTGFKYALAWFMRNSTEVAVIAGPRQIDIDVQARELRGQRFMEILVDGRPTGITTDVGPKWTAWMALREVLCNAIDEGEMRVDRGTCHNDGTRTCVHIRSSTEVDACLTACYFRRAELGTREVLEETKKGSLLPRLGSGTRCYRHGILVWEGPEEGSFDYEDDGLSINEERMADGYEVKRRAVRVLDAASVGRKREAIFSGKEFEERAISIGGHAHATDDASWLEAVAGKTIATREEVAFHSSDPRIKNVTVVADAWASFLKYFGVQTVNKLLKRSCDARGVIHPVDARWREVLPEAISISNKVLDACERPRVAPRDVVLVAEFADSGVRGKWSEAEGRIYVQYGLSLAETVETLLHECAHRDSGAADGTFSFEAELGRTVARLAMRAFGKRGKQ